MPHEIISLRVEPTRVEQAWKTNLEMFSFYLRLFSDFIFFFFDTLMIIFTHFARRGDCLNLVFVIVEF